MTEVKNDKKKCFIITPIGSESDPIRRHIDGILDTVIEPLIDEKGYELVVAHRITTPGSINKQVMSGIYNADIVIANLTNLNPNVMYELAFSHSIVKPTITIAEYGTTKLPFDITTERTIFYKNDFMGVIELKNQLERVIDSIEKNPNSEEIDNPIYAWIDKSLYENKLVEKWGEEASSKDVTDTNLFQYIVGRLDSMEDKINRFSINTSKQDSSNSLVKSFEYVCEVDSNNIDRFISELKIQLKYHKNILKFRRYKYDENGPYLMLTFDYSGIEVNLVENIISDMILNVDNNIKLDKIAATSSHT